MLRSTLAVVLIAFVSFLSRAEDLENPYKNAKVGDWAEYSSHTEGTGFKVDSTMKQTVTAKDDKEVTIKIETEMQGHKNATEQKIDLTKKYDPNALPATMPGGMKPKVDIVKEGDEKVTVAGKEYSAHFVENKITMEMQGTKMESTSKSWTAKDAPLGGLIKMDMTMSMGMKMSMELKGSGAGAK